MSAVPNDPLSPDSATSQLFEVEKLGYTTADIDDRLFLVTLATTGERVRAAARSLSDIGETLSAAEK
ncbi:MAG: hypothetical protein AAF211_23010 [Myxococcota bacterium]